MQKIAACKEIAQEVVLGGVDGHKGAFVGV
jgi:hypothetical protein